MPTVKDMILARMNQPNILIDVKDNFEHLLLDTDWDVEPIIACVNPGKHMNFMKFTEVSALQTHVKNCIGFEDKLVLNERKKENCEKVEKKVAVLS